MTDQAVSWRDRAEGGEGDEPRGADRERARELHPDGPRRRARQSPPPPTKLESEAKPTFDKVGEGFGITKIHLTIRGQVDGIDEEAFKQAAEGAKENCPVSQALKGNVEVTLDASLA